VSSTLDFKEAVTEVTEKFSPILAIVWREKFKLPGMLVSTLMLLFVRSAKHPAL
jgi:hypothetical protein